MTETQDDIIPTVLESLTPDDFQVDALESPSHRSEDRDSSHSRNNSSLTNAISFSPSSATAAQSDYNILEDVASDPSKNAELLDTTKALQQFSRIRQRIEDPITIEKSRDKWKKWKEDNETHVATLEMLRAWVTFTSADNLERFSMITRDKKWNFNLPEPDDLKSLARHYFPCLGDLRVRVIDFGDECTHREETTLKEIHRCERLLFVPSFLLTFLCTRDRKQTSVGTSSLDVSDNLPSVS
jgi:hypothetical protein